MRMALSIHKKIRILEMVYLVTLGMIFLLAALTPLLVKGRLVLTNRFIVEEDLLETILIAAQLAAAYLVSRYYRRRLRLYRQEMSRLAVDQQKLTTDLNEAFSYIGTVNVELQQIQSIFCSLDKYPHNRNDFKKMLAVLTNKARMIAQADWIIARIIGGNHFRTLKECIQADAKHKAPRLSISNRAIMEGQKIEGFCIIGSHQKNAGLRTVCIFPYRSVTTEGRMIIEVIATVIEMLFVIFTSQCEQGFDLDEPSSGACSKGEAAHPSR
jgi:hypothetical protein